MTLEEKLYEVLSPLVDGRVYFDTTPENGPEGYPYLLVSMLGGPRQWYVEQERPARAQHRIAITGVVNTKPKDRGDLADLIEETMCQAGKTAFPATNAFGGWISGRSVQHKEFYSQQQFGVYF